MALLHLLARWEGRARLVAATVDHGLRAEAAGEARLAGGVAAGLGVPHHVLPWTGTKPRTGLQEAAREARYRLLGEFARASGLTHLVTAHTLDDQAETVLMRLVRGSGVGGLAAMRPVAARGNILHHRPLLGTPKSRLVATCRAAGLPFADDPSNRDPRFARTRWRALAPLLAREGLTPERLARLAARAARADEALDRAARAALEAARRSGGYRARAFAEAPAEIGLRMLLLALAEAGSPSDPRLERAEALAETLRAAVSAGARLRRNAGGVLVAYDGADGLAFGPEPPRRRGRGAPLGDR
jgi:tRNA(Ile)-lysidine synthase